MSPLSPLNSLREETALMGSLLELTRQEQLRLVAADIEELAALTLRKNALVLQLSACAKARHAALGAAGLPAAEEGMDAWLAGPGQDADAAPLWAQLLELTRAAKEQNRVNGMLLNKHLAHTQGALATLRPAAQSGNIYGPSGQTTNSAPSRRLVVG
ncbi:flagellar protein FlgN [Janthinobacterium sp.]|uniref:flagella synthesis protein FlgN n=1 Tax=Janthinobacterium sp. TaxID=1871054 RepID=UPI00293D654F|nr:flagellar protein FlgN [Janthinobacterium sp.]